MFQQKKYLQVGKIFKYEFKRQSMEWKHVGSPVKKKFKSQRSTRKVMLTVFWDMQGPITISFLEKGSFVNSANYCELLKQVKKDIKNKRRGHQSKGVIMHHDNAKVSHSSPNGADHQQTGLGTAPSSPSQPRPCPFRLSPVWSLERVHERHKV